MIPAEPVGAVVARGEAEIGLQQASELLPVPGIDYVGPLPAELQKITVFSAGVAAGAKEPDAARALISLPRIAGRRRRYQKEWLGACDIRRAEVDPSS